MLLVYIFSKVVIANVSTLFYLEKTKTIIFYQRLYRSAFTLIKVKKSSIVLDTPINLGCVKSKFVHHDFNGSSRSSSLVFSAADEVTVIAQPGPVIHLATADVLSTLFPCLGQ